MAIEQKHEQAVAITSPTGGAVGTDAKAAHDMGGKGDFGIPVRSAVAKAHEGEIEGRPAGSAPGYSGSKGNRTTGVGSLGGEPGHDSGGDLDTDLIGFGGGAIAAKPVDPDELTGADVTDGSRDKFASGGPAAGRNAGHPGTHGASRSFRGDAVDHSGDDASTNSPNAAGTVTPARGEEPGAEGEVNLDEASGDVDQGAEV
jgi:hypothetical protein